MMIFTYKLNFWSQHSWSKTSESPVSHGILTLVVNQLTSVFETLLYFSNSYKTKSLAL